MWDLAPYLFGYSPHASHLQPPGPKPRHTTPAVLAISPSPIPHRVLLPAGFGGDSRGRCAGCWRLHPRWAATMEDLGIEAKEAAVREVAKLLPLPELLSSIASIKSDYLARQQVMWSTPKPQNSTRGGAASCSGISCSRRMCWVNPDCHSQPGRTGPLHVVFLLRSDFWAQIRCSVLVEI